MSLILTVKFLIRYKLKAVEVKPVNTQMDFIDQNNEEESLSKRLLCTYSKVKIIVL